MSTTPQNAEGLSPLKRAYLALEKLQAKLDAADRRPREPIAILGMGCRFPGGANDPEQYWDLLAAGRDAITEVPPERWDVDAFYDPDPDAPGKVASRFGGFLGEVDRFDAAFFGISPREAESLDPQQRILLEITHEALENACLAPDRLVDSQTGVFMGLANGDYYCMVTTHARERIDAYLGTGTSPNAAAGRLSYVFGLRGPCVAIDTACSSSLVALHLACQSLRAGECDMAVAGGVNVMLSPELSITFSKARMLAPDGRCKTFDAAANGYVRGEGAGVVVLKRLSDALAAGDRVLAVVRGSAVNQDGPSGGLTVPNGPSQQDVIRRALALGDVRPEQVSYIEAHGTGTALGDPIEMGALGAVFGGRGEPLWVGSVKTNVGHLEGAAGIAGVMKVVLALNHQQIPPNLHFHTPSPRIPWSELPVEVPTRPTPWPRAERPRLAGVSSFGFSGINAHVVIEEPPSGKGDRHLLCEAPGGSFRQKVPVPFSEPEPPCYLLPLSAKHPEALRELAARYAARFGEIAAAGPDGVSLADVCYTAATGRSHYEYRLAVVAETATQARERLEAFFAGKPAEGLFADTLTGGLSQFSRSGGLSQFSRSENGTVPFPSDADWPTTLTTLAAEYVAGHDIDWDGLARHFAGRKVSLPAYPFQRRRYWIEPAGTGPAPSPAARLGHTSMHPLLGHRIYSAAAAELVQFENVIAPSRPAYLRDHRIAGAVVLPASVYLEIALGAARAVEPGWEMFVEGLVLEQALQLPEGGSRVVQVVLRPDGTGRRFELYSRPDLSPDEDGPPQWTRHATARLTPLAAPQTPAPADPGELRRRCPEEVPLSGFYERMQRFGLDYGPSFRGLRRLWRGQREVLGEVELPAAAAAQAGRYVLFPPLLDACLHATVELVDPRVQDDPGEQGPPSAFVPVGVKRVERFGEAAGVLWSHARSRERPSSAEPGRYTLDVDVLTPEGKPVARLEGLQAQRVELAALVPAPQQRPGQPPADARAPRNVADGLPGLAPAEQRERIAGFLQEEAARIMKLDPNEPPPRHRSLFELGMDSLMSVEFLYRVNHGLRRNLPMQALLENPAIDQLAERIVREPDAAPGPAAAAQPPTTAPATPASAAPAGEAVPTTIESPWFPERRARPRARVRLFCFHAPGGDAAVYSGWSDVLGPDVEVFAVQLPGSGARADEPPIRQRPLLVETLAEQLLDWLDRPFAFFGHQGGGLLALDVARFAQERFGLSPARLFVAATPPPTPPERQTPGPPEGQAPGRPQGQTPRPALDCPITTFAARADEPLNHEDLHAWYACTTGPFRLELNPGPPTDLLAAPSPLLATLADELRRTADG